MKLNPLHLEKLLENTGLRHRPIPFIHGAATAVAVSPFFGENGDDDGALVDAVACAMLFDLRRDEIPREGAADPRILKVLECLDEIEFEIQDEIEDGRFEPFFGKRSEYATGVETAKQWSLGFLFAAVQKEVFPEPGQISGNAKQALEILTGCAFFDKNVISENSKEAFTKALEYPEVIVCGCVYGINSYWREWDAAHETEGELIEETFVGEEPKTGRKARYAHAGGKRHRRR
jgi:hypothetical protein